MLFLTYLISIGILGGSTYLLLKHNKKIHKNVQKFEKITEASDEDDEDDYDNFI